MQSILYDAPAIEFSTLAISVQYETSFGQCLWLVGSNNTLGNWDPNRDSGRGGVQMQWTNGHIWKAEIDLDSRVMQDFEFKFVVKHTDNGHHFHVIKWEGGNQNHIFST